MGSIPDTDLPMDCRPMLVCCYYNELLTQTILLSAVILTQVLPTWNTLWLEYTKQKLQVSRELPAEVPPSRPFLPRIPAPKKPQSH